MITDDEIRALLVEQESTSPVGPYWSMCIDALSDEWDEVDGAIARAHNRDRAEARVGCAAVLRKRAAENTEALNTWSCTKCSKEKK